MNDFKTLLYQTIKPVVSYGTLATCLLLSAALGYIALTSNLLFFSPKLKILNDGPYPLSPAEYQAQLLSQAPQLLDPFILGEVTGQPNFNKNIDDYDEILQDAAKKYAVNCTLIKATMLAESRGKTAVRSAVGAVGLMQLMPLTARAMGYAANLQDPRVNIMAGAKYMAHLKSRACHEKPQNEVCDVAADIKFRLAAYNGGPKCNKPGWGDCSDQTVWECLYYDAYAQTRSYVDRVKADYKLLKDKGWGC